MKAEDLPGCDEVFLRFFDRWYSAESRGRRILDGTRPDAEGYADRSLTVADLSPLTEDGRLRVAKQVAAMLDASKADWPKYLDVHGEPSVDWVHKFDSYYTVERVANLLESSDPSDYANDLLVTCCEFGAVLGAVMLERLEAADWLYEWPYWESAVYDSRNAFRVNVFHWAVKKFSSYGVEDGFAAKLLATVESAKAGWP